MVRRRIEGSERAKDLSDEAVFCRRYGHGRTPVLPPRRMRDDLASKGQAAAMLRCPECGYTRGEIVDTSTWEVVGRLTPGYPDGYLFTDGQGRWSRNEARREYYARNGRV